MSELRPGTVIAGRFRIERRIGAGAMAFVYEAVHLELRQKVALKFLNDAYRADQDAASRFVREARAQFSLRSEHVGRVFDVGRTESGQPFIVMELLEGQSLKEVLDERERLGVDEALSILEQVCEGVGEAHALGIVHRDLKPGNIFVTKDPKNPNGAPLVKVLDFGLAKAREHASEGSLTAADMLIGTPRYMAPEQFAHAGMVGAATDVWALGIVLYRMVTGDLPFDGPHPLAIAQRIRSEDPVPPTRLRPDLPEPVSALILKCLARDPVKRFANATELGHALASLARPSMAPVSPRAAAMKGTLPAPAPVPRRSQPSVADEEELSLSLSGNDATEIAPSPPVSLAALPPGGVPASDGEGTSQTRIVTAAPGTTSAVSAAWSPGFAPPMFQPPAAPHPMTPEGGVLPLPPPLEDPEELATRKRPALVTPVDARVPGPAYRASSPGFPPASPSSAGVASPPSSPSGLAEPAPPSTPGGHPQVEELKAKLAAAGPAGLLAIGLVVVALILLVVSLLPPATPPARIRSVQSTKKPEPAPPPPVVPNRVFTTLDEAAHPVDAGAASAGHRSFGR